ncbi:uncharacterized protein LOC132624311 [Lycium barbarum]|uniref:uncharacterized protein LOC132624311 n=1 Tax=Lycium barbarum TaxID=112863 RepID=UPI00293F46B5|nr:uncharacterized protein LOC132624311 [Lycium barbarum]
MRKFWPELIAVNNIVNKGKFQIAPAYKHLRGDVPIVDWKHLTCHNVAEPKRVFILWLTLLGRLRTKDRLIKWGLSVDDQCVFCNSAIETALHLFFNCPFSHTIWLGILQWLQWQRNILPWNEEWKWVNEQARGKHARERILKASLATVVYNIWIERNTRVFQHKSRSIDDILLATKTGLCYRFSSNRKYFDFI